MMYGAMNAMLMSIVPATKPAYTFTAISTYWTLLKPSARSSSSATYCGAMQTPGIFASRMVVVSGSASCAEIFATPRRPAAVVEESVSSKRRRVCLDCITCLLSREILIDLPCPLGLPRTRRERP
jgi:hypothetical protein